MSKYIVKYIRNTKSNHVSTTVEMSREEAIEVYNSDINYYKNESKTKPYKSIALCKIEHFEIKKHNFK